MAATATARFTKRSMASFLLLTLNHALAALVPPPSVLSTDAFKRVNPKSDRFDVLGFHHVELYCSDATCTAGRFSHALGMDVLATSRNSRFASIAIGSGDVKLSFTAPLPVEDAAAPAPADGLAATLEYDASDAHAFVENHGGVAVRAVCVRVADVKAAYDACVDGGGEGVLSPRELVEPGGEAGQAAAAEVAEVKLYGDVVLRFLRLDEDAYDGSHIPGYTDAESSSGSSGSSGGAADDDSFGIARFDHIVGNVWEMTPTIKRLQSMLGFHEFAEFTAEDVGTIDSGLNSMVLANNLQNVLLPINEPTYGTRRRSQIETYLVANKGEGVQHMALFTDDIFETIRRMRRAGERGGFQFMDAPSEQYYQELPERIGDDVLSAEQLATAKELGLLVDRDPEGVLIQVFTRPVGDRPTLFLEIIQRVGCMVDAPVEAAALPNAEAVEEQMVEVVKVQRGGCGGFGKGNFKELFKSVEDYERSLEEAAA